MTTGAIAVDASDQSRSGQETFKSLPHLGSYCYPLKVGRNRVRSLWDPFPPTEVSPCFLGLLQRSIADLQDLVEQGITIALTLVHEI